MAAPDSQFEFLRDEWPMLFEPATKALVYPDSRAACFYARRVLELAVAWLYKTCDGEIGPDKAVFAARCPASRCIGSKFASSQDSRIR